MPQAKKKAKRTDTSLLDEAISPRKKAAENGDDWKHPMHITGPRQAVTYSAPGAKWERVNTDKLQVLFSLAKSLKSHGLLERPMTFNTVMEWIGADSRDGPAELDFNDRVFVFYVALTLHVR